MKHRRIQIFVILLFLVVMLCSSEYIFNNAVLSGEVTHIDTYYDNSVSDDTDSVDTIPENQSDVEHKDENADFFDYSMLEKYSGNPVCFVNNNVPFFDEKDKLRTDCFEEYSDFDNLGRCGVAFACIGIETMPTEERGQIGIIRPSGWHTIKYDFIDGKYLYNRCHLIGYQLSGENAIEENLITGTRYLNIEGMLPYEYEVSDYIYSSKNHVLYRVTPYFEGENLVANGVLIEGWSIEDKGKGLCFCVYAYNVQPGVNIDYLTGVSSEQTRDDLIEIYGDDAAETERMIHESDPPLVTEDEQKKATYIGNKNSHKFHYPYCDSVGDMKEKNKVFFYGAREEVIDAGYKPCGNCKP